MKKPETGVPGFFSGEHFKLLLRMIGARLRRFGRFTVFHPSFIAKMATFLGFLLALRRRAVLIRFFFNEASGFLDLSFNAHFDLQSM
jgi:hypothetical protein